jgi:signal transduction histidine kinase
MKIRPSLRLYFFISIVLLGTAMAVGFSLLSVNYYIDGLDKGIKSVMHELAKTPNIEDGKPQHLLGFTIASRWQDTPKIIQQRFISPPEKLGNLLKIKDQDSIFSMPENIYFVVLYQEPNSENIRYISRVMLDKNRPAETRSSGPLKRFYWILIIGLASIVIFAFLVILIMQKIAKPIESLKVWAKSLDQNNIKKTLPDFTYNELNILASIIQNSLMATHKSLDREQRFLSYASHELRTPISVIRSNVDLLKRLSEKNPLTSKQQLTLQRIERAGLTMSDLTDTLLWLSRTDDQKEQGIILEPVNLYKKINHLCDELNYLLNSKDVEVTIKNENCADNETDSCVEVAAIACHIVLSNLIRNAYQHTQQGNVHISLNGSCVTIINSHEASNYHSLKNDKENARANSQQAELGYGLGLQLSEKIIKHQDWFYEIKNSEDYYQVSVEFNS